MWLEIVAGVCLVWYIFIVVVSTIGYIQLFRHYSSLPPISVSETLPDQRCPHVTVIRPIIGLEPNLYDCLASTFRQTYPRAKLTIFLCISSRKEPSLPILEKLLEDYPQHDAKILVEEEDPVLMERSQNLGPNPKIRNMSRAYREAKGDLVWSLDCNIWVGKGICGRMVDKLSGFTRNGPTMPYKFVHHLPIAVDLTCSESLDEGHSLLSGNQHASSDNSSYSSRAGKSGARLEELFLSSSHAKFYTAINTVVIAPCIVGKSNMFRRSHLDHLTSGLGIDYFSDNICEDHLIGDLLWRGDIPDNLLHGGGPIGFNARRLIGNHALCFGDLAIQPLANMSISSYIARRVRWLRVRKFTVTLATLVEPGTESFLCSAYGAFAIANLPYFQDTWSIPASLTSALLFWLASVSIWAVVDFTVYILLHSAKSVEVDDDTPMFASPPSKNGFLATRRPFYEWFAAWLGREAFAFPIWAWAVWGGVTVIWRGRRFWVGMDMKVHEIKPAATSTEPNGIVRGDSERRALLNGAVSAGSPRISGGSREARGVKARKD